MITRPELLSLLAAATGAVWAKRAAQGREYRRSVCREIAVKQFEKQAERLEDALEPFFRQQIDAAAALLGSATGDDPEKITRQIFRPRDWDNRLVDVTLPALARGMAEAAVAEVLALGYSIKPGKRKATKSTATDWLNSAGTEVPPGVVTEFPDWMKDRIAEELRATFEEPYWQKINDTTASRIETFLRNGLQNGASVRELSKQIHEAFPEEYSKKRAKTVAITESGNSLNASRNLAFQQLKEELPPEAAKYIGKEWLSVLGDTTRDAHADADGQLADEDGNFTVGGYKVPWPSHRSLPADLRINCQCSLTVELGAGAPEDEIQAILAEGRLPQEEVSDGPMRPIAVGEAEEVDSDPSPPPALLQLPKWDGQQETLLKFVEDDPQLEQWRTKLLEAGREQKAEIERLKDEEELHRKRYEEINAECYRLQTDYVDADPVRRQEIMKQVDGMVAELERTRKLCVNAFESRQKLTADKIASSSLLEPTNGLKLDISLAKKYKPNKDGQPGVVEKTKEASAFLKAVVAHPDDKELPGVEIHRHKASRAYYRSSDRTAHVHDKNDVKTYVHEIAHHLEVHLPGALEGAAAFVRERIKSSGKPNVKLANALPGYGYRSDEIGNDDDFFKAFQNDKYSKSRAYYAGKTYGSGSKIDATEIISLGLEQLYTDPVGFAENDPQYFKFITAVIKGRLK